MKELTLSENTKKKINKIEDNQTDNNINNKTYKYNRKYNKIFPIKRNYNSLLVQSNLIQENQNKCNQIISQNNISNNNNHNNELIINQQNLGKEKEIQRQKEINEREKEIEKEIDRIIEREKKELKSVDKVAQELLESKNENELKEYLFNQLQLLDQKKRNNNNSEQMKDRINSIINQLIKDKFDLRKCNIGVTKALNKKIVEIFNLENKEKQLENEIKNVNERIKYHEIMGDFYKAKIKQLHENNYEEL